MKKLRSGWDMLASSTGSTKLVGDWDVVPVCEDDRTAIWGTSSASSQGNWRVERPPALPQQTRTSLASSSCTSNGDIDLNRPLSHYWINSSHNTYIAGNQFCSQSSPEAIIKALRKGCRVVELDVYDGDKFNILGPAVLHGGTLTSVVSMESCLIAMRDHAFEVSDAPVILTLENHTKEDGQRQVAQLLRRVFGDSLHIPESPCFPFEWPAPKELLRRFLIRVKATKVRLNLEGDLQSSPTSSCQTAKSIVEEAFSEDGWPTMSTPQARCPPQAPIADSKSPQADLSVPTTSNITPSASKSTYKNMMRNGKTLFERGLEGLSKPRIPKMRLAVVKSLPSGHKVAAGMESAILGAGRKGAYYSGAGSMEAHPVVATELTELVTVGNLDQKTLKTIMEVATMGLATSTSFSDVSFCHKLSKRGREWWCRYTCEHLARIYPSPHHIDSSNYDPQDAWEVGCQIVALNFQGSYLFHSTAMWANAGKFRANGGCGYVPKPAHLLPTVNGGGCPQAAQLRVTVTMGIGWEVFKDVDWFSPPDFFIMATLAGAKQDRCHKKTSVCKPRSKSSSDVGYPRWDEEMLFDISDVDLAVLVLVAWDKDPVVHDFLGQNAFPVLDLQPGENQIRLLSNDGEALQGEPQLVCDFDLQLR